MADQQKVV